MALTTEQIIGLLSLPKLGRATVLSMVKNAYGENISLCSPSDLYGYITRYSYTNHSRITMDYSMNEVIKALNEAEEILLKSQSQGIKVVTYFDSLFPNSLKNIVDTKNNTERDVSPVILYYKGNIENINQNSAVAIVGSRKAIKEALTVSEYLGEAFANANFDIVSGLAIGCDAAAHKGALRSKKGKAIAILAHGLETISPKTNQDLAEDILSNAGALISEYPVGTKAFKTNFVERDRLQCGLASASIIIQASIDSGTMHVANASESNHKLLYAVKYKYDSIMDDDSMSGNKYLLRTQKAKPISSCNYKDIIEDIKDDESRRLNYGNLL